MAGETPITIIGNLTADPELRYTANGAPVANFTVASTPRTFDRQTNDFKDGETLFLRCSAWRDMAEHVAETLSRGTRVIAQGNLASRTFDTKEGDRRTVFELDVQEVGPSLRYATATVTKVDRRNQQQGGGGYQQAPQQGQPSYSQGQQAQGWGQPSGGDPWGGAPAQSSDAPF